MIDSFSARMPQNAAKTAANEQFAPDFGQKFPKV